ncbi:MAG: crossover junction endodeoxyribonuclease RuvC [Chitinophagaceae bacterium]|nr:crossover junction endodeoxyribonuclease RuvC [Chitinophagaceae bacterium]
MHTKSQIILGIDPGTLVMGYGVIAVNERTIKLLEMNAIKLSAQKDHYERLHMIHQKVLSLIHSFKPDHFAIEAPFFGKNVQSMLKLGRAQGVAIAVAMQAGIPVTEYSPRKIKQSITGNGNADKEQVWKMLQHIADVSQVIQSFDASDALAVAVCHQLQLSSVVKERKIKPVKRNKGSWQEFIAGNPQRVVIK